MNDNLQSSDDGADAICVLLVDDEPDLADLTATYLAREDEQIDVQTAMSAEEGLQTLAEHDVDCIVSDYDMPGRNGIEFLEAVREIDPDLPFILYTGKGSEEIASDAISAGVSDYLQKETGTDQYAILANRIRNYVERMRAQREHEIIRERMEFALEKTHSEVFEIDPETGIATAHGYLERFSDHLSADNSTWQDYLEQVVHPDDQEIFGQFYRQLMAGGRESGTLEYRVSPESGNVRWLRDTVHVSKMDPHQVIGIVQDITVQKKEEEKRKQIIQRVTDAIVEVDSDWQFTLVNEQAEALYDISEEFLLGRKFWDVFAEARGTRFERESRRVMETREPASFVEYFSQLDRWFDIEAYPKDDGGIAFYFIEITEQRKRQRELEQTNSLIATLFETLPVGVLAEDASRNVLAVNDRLFELFDLSGSQAEIIGADCEQMTENVSEMFVDSEGFVQRTNELVAKRESIGSEELALRDGRIFERSYQPVELPHGDGHLWVYRDITEQKKREQQLQEEQQFVKSIFDAVPDPLYALDTDGYPIRWNEQLEAVTGYTREEIETMYVTEFIPDGETDRIDTNFRTALEERHSIKVESAFETKSGDRIPFEFSGAPLEDADGSLRGVTGVGRDITEHKEHTDQLRALNERSQDLMAAETREQITEIGVDAARDILDLDANAVYLYDATQSALVPMAATDSISDLTGGLPSFTAGESITWRAYEQGAALAIDDVHDDPDVYNPETPIRSGIYLPLDEHGILVAGSPTEDQFDQEDLVLGEILAANIVSAFDQVTRTEQLRDHKQELIRKNDRLTEFASIVSHDLRNPLNVAEGRLEFAQEECETEHHDAIADALDRMNRIIEDVLLLAREGRDIGSVEPVAIQETVDAAWNIVADNADQATLQYVSPDQSPAVIEADDDRFRQLLENLFRNAIEHGGEDVTVTVGVEDDGIYVEDDGPGISEDKRDEVFSAGYSTSKEGTGFGLSIVKQVAEAHDWKVHITDSTLGGVRFEITGIEFRES